MKKITAIFSAIIILLSLFTFSVYAEETTYLGRYESYVTVRIDKYSPHGGDSEYRNMVRNPYYQKYYNELLDYSYQVYMKLWGEPDNKAYIESYAKKYIVATENYVTLILKKNDDSAISATEYNLNILKKYFQPEDILYVSDYTFAAVVSISAEEADVVNRITELEFIGDAFFTNGETMRLPAEGTYTLGNVLLNDKSSMGDSSDVNAADARFLLRYAAGLETVGAEKYFYFCADMNFDNTIDSADARLALRTAAGLEEPYYISYSYFQFWKDFMGVLDK